MNKIIVSFIFAVSFLALSGCVNTPTEFSGVKDDRPYIMFTGVSEQDTILLDGLTIGQAMDYQEGKSGLRIESGTHVLQVIRDGQQILKQKFYLSRGSSKTFIISQQ